MIRWLRHLYYKERLMELRLFSLEKRRLQRDVTVSIKYLKRSFRKKNEKSFFIWECSDWTKQ